MKKFLLKILIVLASVLVLLCALAAFDVFVVGGMFKYNYQASVVDKLERLETVTGPKIILVGHSNVSFGFDFSSFAILLSVFELSEVSRYFL